MGVLSDSNSPLTPLESDEGAEPSPLINHPDDPFAKWQLADEVANAAERRLYNTVAAFAAGRGRPPTKLHIDVARALRESARRRLREAAKATREGPH